MRLPNGTLTFEVTRDDEPTTWKADCVELKLLCEELEGKHGVVEKDGQMTVTTPFLQELAERLHAMGLTGCGVTAAHAVWHTTNVQFTHYNERLATDLAKMME